MKRTPFLLSIVVGLQVLWMAGTSISKELHLSRDTTVLLETIPVDPRDLLRGDFVTLNYKFSNLPAAWILTADPRKSLNNQAVYVTLEKRGSFHEAMAASLEPVQPQPGKIIVRGLMDASWGSEPNRTVRVRYGIEKFFVKEGTGNPNGKVTVKSAVGPDGSMLIKEVYVNGKPYAEAMRSVNP